jgi:uncharacterized membrane protein
LFLFVLGLIVVRNRLKWWLLGTVLLTLFLSFGRNLPFLSDIFFNYFPLYNKFRAVESILAVASLCFPILALLAVQEVIENPDKKAITKKLYIAGGIVGGLTLVLIAVPTVFLSFRTDNHTDMVNYLAQALKTILLQPTRWVKPLSATGCRSSVQMLYVPLYSC